MRYFLLMLLLAAANAFAGDLVMPNRDGTAQMRLLETSCSEPNILAHLKPEARAERRTVGQNDHDVTVRRAPPAALPPHRAVPRL